MLKVLDKFPLLNIDWLVTGRGDMECTHETVPTDYTDQIERSENNNRLLYKENKELRAENDELREKLGMKKSAG
ncbi:hypothetical protein Barb6XT_03187 [Bacteroidales bacterium Barb6XT]|nr:hypothetical protein Barb6XT_03187 [Bacteroidales bacterium Barb6XT]